MTQKTIAPPECAARAMYPETKAGGLDDDSREALALRFARTKSESRRIHLARLKRGAHRLGLDTAVESKQDDLNLDVPPC